MSTTINAGNATTGAAISADTTGILQLQSGSTPTTAVTIDASQNVGIGTSSPSYKLQVNNGQLATYAGTGERGGIQTFAYSSTNSYDAPRWSAWRARGTVASPSAVQAGDELASFQSSGYANNSTFVYTGGIYLYATGTISGANVPSYMSFETNAGGAASERMRIDSSGQVLINSTTGASSGRFEVAGDSDGTFNPMTVTQQAAGSTNRTSIGFYRTSAGANVGSISTTNSVTLYNTTSDYRLKTVIAPISDSGTRIDALKPIEYDWKIGGRTRGFLAHQFAEVYPNSVSGEKDAVDEEGKPVYQAMQASTPEVIADLIAEIQSLRKRLTVLEAK